MRGPGISHLARRGRGSGGLLARVDEGGARRATESAAPALNRQSKARDAALNTLSPRPTSEKGRAVFWYPPALRTSAASERYGSSCRSGGAG